MRVVIEPVAMQISPVNLEPGLGTGDMRTDAVNQPPETAGVIHLDEMGDLVRGQIIEDEWRRQHQPP